MTDHDDRFRTLLSDIDRDGLYKHERVITSPQGAEIITSDGRTLLNFCANNYLGLANHPQIIDAATDALRTHGYGMASVRFICGTQDLHTRLEAKIAQFMGTEEAILYSSCFDANAGLFETLLGPEDAVLSDALNHASIIDGIRLCKAARFRYLHSDMRDLEEKLQHARQYRLRLIATDGVFSMDGDIARLDEITALARKYDAWVMVDDSHATGILGPNGKGSAEYHAVMDKIDIYTSTLGKALGGASGGFTAARKVVVDVLRQRSRPYLFSNTVAPPLVAASLKALELVEHAQDLRRRLHDNARALRQGLRDAGFDLRPGEHPIVPVMLYDAVKAKDLAAALYEDGIYVIAFSYPVVPKGQARIRVQVSAAHTEEHIERAVVAFARAGRERDSSVR
jgi:glycine C-acetyltransferase